METKLQDKGKSLVMQTHRMFHVFPSCFQQPMQAVFLVAQESKRRLSIELKTPQRREQKRSTRSVAEQVMKAIPKRFGVS